MRLSQKPGVQSTLLLSRHNGAILKTTGLISKPVKTSSNHSISASIDDTEGYTNGGSDTGLQSGEDVARLVFKFVEAAGMFVDGLDKDEEVRLLRVRTKKNELVIVPSMSLCLYENN
jgi:dynein light chain roadblock-type